MSRKMVLGLGNNIDYEVAWDAGKIQQLATQMHIGAAHLCQPHAITSIKELLCSILVFLHEGKGGEKHVTDAAIIEEFSQHFRCEITLGGTPVRAAACMAKLGQSPWLHLVSMNDHVRRLLPKDCPYICSAAEEKIFPHLIIQFQAGDTIKLSDTVITAKHSNRIIYVNDADNASMAISPQLEALLKDAQLFLVGGFNAMHDNELLEKRLQATTSAMASLPEGAQVFYEDACFHQPEMSHTVREALLPFVGIYSMNEDEMQTHLGHAVDLLDAQAVAQAMAQLALMIPVPLLVVHTRHWALAYGHHAATMHHALLGGIAMATTRLRLGDCYGAEDYKATLSFPPEPEGLTFSEEISTMLGSDVCCVPSVLVNVAKATTIGLGDAFVGGFLAALGACV